MSVGDRFLDTFNKLVTDPLKKRGDGNVIRGLQDALQSPIIRAGRTAGKLTTKLTNDENLGQAVEGGFTDFAGGSTGDFGTFKKGFKQSFKGGSAFFGDLFDTTEPLEEPDLGDPFENEGRQSARDTRRRGGGGNTILTSNSNSPSLLG